MDLRFHEVHKLMSQQAELCSRKSLLQCFGGNDPATLARMEWVHSRAHLMNRATANTLKQVTGTVLGHGQRDLTQAWLKILVSVMGYRKDQRALGYGLAQVAVRAADPLAYIDYRRFGPAYTIQHPVTHLFDPPSHMDTDKLHAWLRKGIIKASDFEQPHIARQVLASLLRRKNECDPEAFLTIGDALINVGIDMGITIHRSDRLSNDFPNGSHFGDYFRSGLREKALDHHVLNRPTLSRRPRA